jgi:predicted acyl esterase
MQNYFIRQLFIAFFLFISLNFNLQAGNVRNDKEVRKLEITIPMKDGTLLATDIYLPETDLPVPVILVRTPYNKDGVKNAAEKFLKYNIAVVSQDCRGKFKSGGEFYPFLHERDDGLITLKWIRKQSRRLGSKFRGDYDMGDLRFT